MNRKWFYVLSSMLAAALAVVIILAVTFHNTGQDLQNGAAMIRQFREYSEDIPSGTDIPYGSTPEEHQAAFQKWGDTEMDADRRARYPEGFVPLTPQEQSLLNKMDNITEDMLLGDDGEEGPLITGNIETGRKASESYAMLLCRTAFRYNRKLAYMENGADWGGGIVPSDRCPKSMAGLTGIGNPEYIQMLYMYTFGYVPDKLMDMEKISETCNNITPEELKTGDIGIMELEDGRKDFAVCIGAYKEFFLFAHCVNTADSSFPGGCARICFMASQTESYYRGSGPADFTSFYQSPIGFWGNPDSTDSNGELPDQRILINISEKPYGNDFVYRYADAMVHELATGNPDDFLSDLARKELIKYGYEYTDENTYRQYLHKIYETIHDRDYLYVAFINDRDDHYNAAIYGLDYGSSSKDITYDYGSTVIIYFTIFYDKENGFTMLPYNAGTIGYNYSQYGLSPIP